MNWILLRMTVSTLRSVLFGWTTTQSLWPYIHPPLLLGYGPLCVAPRWKHSFTLSLALPIVHSLLYAAIFVPLMAEGPAPGQDPPDIANMKSIFQLFADPDIFFCGWLHYLSFDLLVARGCAQDALEVCQVTDLQYYTMVVPCIFGCFYVGPIGFLMYMGLRTFVFPNNNTKNTKRTKEE